MEVSLCLKNFFYFILLIVFGCSNPNIISDQNSIGLKDVSTDFPSRTDVIKNEENVISDRSLLVTGKDLYVNSKFMRSVIPASRFKFIGSRDLSSDMQFSNDETLNSIAKELYDKATDEEKREFEENIDTMIFKVDIVIVADPTNDYAKQLVAEEKELNKYKDELYNKLGLEEVVIETDAVNRSISEGSTGFNIKNYKPLNKHNRYTKSNEVIVKASDLATYFMMNNDLEEVENINKMFGTNIDINKLKKLNIKNSKTRSGIPNWMFGNELFNTAELIKNYGQNGDIISRGLNYACGYGWYDHTGLFNKKVYSDPKTKYYNTKWARCMLASYPTGFQPISPERSTERVEYASYEPLANFTDGYRMVANRVSGGDLAMKKAIDHFYGTGSKSDYDKWCQGQYGPAYYNRYYNAASETLRITNASDYYPEKVNYCSYIAWYGYMYGVGIDLDSDLDRTSTGNMKVPDDIVNSCYPKYREIWVSTPATGCGIFFGGGSGYYKEEQYYWPKSQIWLRANK